MCFEEFYLTDGKQLDSTPFVSGKIPETYEELLNSSIFFKLTRKKQFETHRNGQLTVYGYFLQANHTPGEGHESLSTVNEEN